MIIRAQRETFSLSAAVAVFGLGGIAGALAPTHTAAVVIITLAVLVWVLALLIGTLAGHAMGWSIWALGLSAGAITGVAIITYRPDSDWGLFAAAAIASCLYIGIEVARVLRAH